MVDSLTLYNAQFHKVKLTETNGAVHIETAILYESKDDSDEGVAKNPDSQIRIVGIDCRNRLCTSHLQIICCTTAKEAN